MHIIFFVLDDPKKLDKILEAWQEIGIRGVTIIESTGVRRRTSQKEHIPMRFAGFIPELMVGGEEGNLTLITIVRDERKIKRCIAATEEIVGDLNEPNTGILAAWPLSHIKGLPHLEAPPEGEN
jgi:hypothetical protein